MSINGTNRDGDRSGGRRRSQGERVGGAHLEDSEEREVEGGEFGGEETSVRREQKRGPRHHL